MPIDFIPGTRTTPVLTDEQRAERQREAVREGMIEASKSAAICAVPAMAVLIIALFSMRSAFVAASDVLREGHEWFSAFMPATLFMIYGLILGLLLGWRIAEGAGLSGMPAWLIGALAVVAIVLVGGIASFAIFAQGIPTMAWLALAAVAVAALPGFSYFAFWAA